MNNPAASGSREGAAGREQCFSNRVTGCTLEGSTMGIAILWVLILMVFSDMKDILGHLGDSFIDKHYCRHPHTHTHPWVIFVLSICKQLTQTSLSGYWEQSGCDGVWVAAAAPPAKAELVPGCFAACVTLGATVGMW